VLLFPDGSVYLCPCRSGNFSFEGRTVMVNKELLDILACPQCKGKVVLDENGAFLVCGTCHLRYPIEDDIPIMLIDRAEKTD
jgi:uncharacterized protein YbaR (Trm112 family)